MRLRSNQCYVRLNAYELIQIEFALRIRKRVLKKRRSTDKNLYEMYNWFIKYLERCQMVFKDEDNFWKPVAGSVGMAITINMMNKLYGYLNDVKKSNMITNPYFHSAFDVVGYSIEDYKKQRINDSKSSQNDPKVVRPFKKIGKS